MLPSAVIRQPKLHLHNALTVIFSPTLASVFETRSSWLSSGFPLLPPPTWEPVVSVLPVVVVVVVLVPVLLAGPVMEKERSSGLLAVLDMATAIVLFPLVSS